MSTMATAVDITGFAFGMGVAGGIGFSMLALGAVLTIFKRVTGL